MSDRPKLYVWTQAGTEVLETDEHGRAEWTSPETGETYYVLLRTHATEPPVNKQSDGRSDTESHGR